MLYRRSPMHRNVDGGREFPFSIRERTEVGTDDWYEDAG